MQSIDINFGYMLISLVSPVCVAVPMQLKSVRLLLELDFEWILPGGCALSPIVRIHILHCDSHGCYESYSSNHDHFKPKKLTLVNPTYFAGSLICFCCFSFLF